MIDKYVYDSCSRCNGSGVLEPNPLRPYLGEATCHICEGTGREPNEHGKAVLDLVKTYLRRY